MVGFGFVVLPVSGLFVRHGWPRKYYFPAPVSNGSAAPVKAAEARTFKLTAESTAERWAAIEAGPVRMVCIAASADETSTSKSNAMLRMD